MDVAAAKCRRRPVPAIDPRQTVRLYWRL